METWLAGIHRNYLEREYTIPEQLRRQVLRLPQTAEVCVGVGGSLATRLRRWHSLLDVDLGANSALKVKVHANPKTLETTTKSYTDIKQCIWGSGLGGAAGGTGETMCGVEPQLAGTKSLSSKLG